METIRLEIGSSVVNSGRVIEDWRPVEFEGEKLAEVSRYRARSDSRGTVQTLYRTADGRLVAHVYNWSRWQGEPDTKQLCEVSEADLSPTGRFAELGHEAGFWNAMTLDQALQTQGDQRGEGV
jgi:hypothetical protein